MRTMMMLAAGAALILSTVAVEAKVNLNPVQPSQAGIVMHARHEGMEAVGKSMKQLLRSVKSDPVDVSATRANATAMNRLAQQSTNWFLAGTGPDKGRTGAKADIWKNPKDFAAKAEGFQVAAAALDAAARTGDSGRIQAAFGDLGKTCKACHDSYRTDMHH